MTEISRRTLLASSATAGALTLTPGFVDAFFSSANAQAAGFNRYKVGSIEVTGVADGVNTMPLPDRFVTNSTKEEVSKALTSAGLDGDKLHIPFNPVAIKTGNRLVVIDTGMGPGMNAKNPAVGQFQKNFSAAGYDATKVTDVVISHFHGDHINGLLGADGKSLFPNAQVLVPTVEWKYWTDEGELSRAPEGRKGAFANVKRIFIDGLKGKVAQYEHGKEVVPGVTSLATIGHTPGHTSFVVASGNDKVFIQSDVTNIPSLFVANPGWHAVYDQDAKMAEATRRKTYDMLVAEKMRVQGFHFPFPSLGRVEKAGNGYRLAAA